jgi:hypothetical protein
VIGWVNPGLALALGGSNISVAHKILNRINEVGQLIACHIRLAWFMPSRAAFSLASNPFFCVPVSEEEALTLFIRFWTTACGVSTVTVKRHVAVLPWRSSAV